VTAARAAGAAAAVGGLARVEVVAMAVVVEPMFVCCFVLVRVVVPYCLVSVTRGTQGSQLSLCGLPRPVRLIITDV